ncbi:MAG: hypothetical protein Harvfovirus12_29 [Harvfovirus sp.]|uniref:Glycosyltransferase 2-like domain-containing protein n=1 Tax=Harvfovirus sp. TaxID=2487768 RepID=A0A3G5A597_9VIRU|nr:MAG: hypothetical protein Harvfovirus12_29 [Harvfovirus sp.]
MHTLSLVVYICLIAGAFGFTIDDYLIYTPMGMMHFVHREEYYFSLQQHVNNATIPVEIYEPYYYFTDWRTYLSVSGLLIWRWAWFILFTWIPAICCYHQMGVVNKDKSHQKKRSRSCYRCCCWEKTLRGKIISCFKCCYVCGRDMTEANAKEEYFDNNDVTIVIPVHNPPSAFVDTLKSLLAHNPAKIIVISSAREFPKVMAKCAKFPPDKVELYVWKKKGKRAALVLGSGMVKTKIVAFVDDDVGWITPKFLSKMLAPFSDPTIGGVGCRHTARISSFFDWQGILANMRLAVRSLELRATTWLDGGASCISGRTAFYRMSVFNETPERLALFQDYLENEYFQCGLFYCGKKFKLLSGDDKCITRFVINMGYKLYHQMRDSCILDTTFETGEVFRNQLLRWSRNTWRSDITAIFYERYIWLNTFATACQYVNKFITPIPMLYGISYYIYKLVQLGRWELGVGWLAWLIFSRIMKVGHYLVEKGHATHIVYVPVFLIFQYYQLYVKLRALFSLHVTGWLTKDIAITADGSVINTNKIIKSANYDNTSDAKEEKKPIDFIPDAKDYETNENGLANYNKPKIHNVEEIKEVNFRFDVRLDVKFDPIADVVN